jgi:hypothetical protein
MQVANEVLGRMRWAIIALGLAEVLADEWAITAVVGAICSSFTFAQEISLFPLPVSKQTKLPADHDRYRCAQGCAAVAGISV